MILWLNPAALAALMAVAAPVVVHLLLRHRATRVVIPTVRFVTSTVPSAIRLRWPSDGWLLLVRVAIIGLAAAAVAGPLFITDARRTAWDDRVARALIVDIAGGNDARLNDTARVEEAGADLFRRIDTRELAPAVRRAANWLKQSPPARREIVVLSPFVLGALSAADLSVVPQDVGLRFVRAERPPALPFRESILTREGRRILEATVEGDATVARYQPPEPLSFDGLVIQAGSDDAEAIARIHRVIARVGVTAPQPRRPVFVRLRRGAQAAPGPPPDADAAAAALRLVQDPALTGLPVEVTAAGGELRVSADVEAASAEAATIVRAALEARVDPRQRVTHDPAVIPEGVLQAWSREPGTPSPEAWRQSDDSDARWFWLAVLVLLGIETAIRRQARRATEVMADAA